MDMTPFFYLAIVVLLVIAQMKLLQIAKRPESPRIHRKTYQRN